MWRNRQMRQRIIRARNDRARRVYCIASYDATLHRVVNPTSPRSGRRRRSRVLRQGHGNSLRSVRRASNAFRGRPRTRWSRPAAGSFSQRRGQDVLHRLIEDVLNFARLEAGKLEYRYEDVAIDRFLETLEAFVAPRLDSKNLAYSLESCPNAVVAVDRDKLEQILLNLLSNAVKFTDRGRIEVHCSVDDEHLRIEVRDTGRGIRQDLLEDIFEPFVQGDQGLTRSAGGTGLGLSISRQLAHGSTTV